MAENERQRIAVVVVTYNRKELLGQCLDALLAQTHLPEAIYIIDNASTDGTYAYLLEKGLIAAVREVPEETVRTVEVSASSRRPVAVHYVPMTENTGGAGGFHEGMMRCVDAGYDWLWLMDDDLRVAPEALEVLVDRQQALSAAGGGPFILNSLVLDRGKMDDDTLAFPLLELTRKGLPRFGAYHWRLSEVRDQIVDGLYRWASPFNGTFVSTRTIREVGPANKDFFIKCDERDFVWRAAKTHDFYTAVESKVFHPRFRGGGFDWRSYYAIRNMLIVNRRLNWTLLRNLKLIGTSLVRGLRHGRPGTRLVLAAIRDGLSGRLGKREDIHSWPHAS